MSEVRRKPWQAGLLSLFVPGLGQVYNGQALKGVLFHCLGACRRNPKISIFWGGKALPRLPIVDPGAFCEVNF
jgi:hypothetical protein